MKPEEIVRALRCRLTSDELEVCEKANVGEHGCAECLVSYTHEAAALIERLTTKNADLRKELEWKDMVIALAQKKQTEAEAERDALREKVTQWISVEERLPEDRGDVLVVAYWHERWGVHLGWCARERGAWSVHVGSADRSDLNVTYWMPLPEAPEEKKHESE